MLRPLILAALLGAALACSGFEPGVDYATGPVERVEVIGPPVQRPYVLRVGNSMQFTALGYNSEGRQVVDASFEWEISAFEYGLATVTSTGLVTAVRKGTVSVQACTPEPYIRCGGSGVYQHLPVRRIDFGHDSVGLFAAEERLVAGLPRDSTGAVIEPAPPIQYSSADPSVATVDVAGKVMALAPGRTVIAESVDGHSADLPVRVRERFSLAEVASGNGFTCGLSADGAAVCWGGNRSSQLGIVTPKQCTGSAGQYCAQGESALPVFVSGWRTFAQISSGGRHSCGLTPDGEALCWGSNFTGQLGGPTVTGCSDLISGQGGPCSAMPIRVQGDHRFASIDAGEDQTCAVTTAGAAYCWGFNSSGQLGNGSTTRAATPVLVAGGLTFRNVSVGYSHSCGVTTDNTAYCWGSNTSGRLGTGSATPNAQLTPVPVTGGLKFSQIAAGGVGTCGVTTERRVYCWGGDYTIGVTPAPDGQQPVPISIDRTFTTIAMNTGLACALDEEGAAYCWGFANRLPNAVQGAPPLRTLSVGYWANACGVARDNVAYCWNGDLVARKAPGQP